MMSFADYAKRRLELEACLVETYEEEATMREVLELKRRQLMKALQDNFEEFKSLHTRKEHERRELKESIEKLEAEHNGKEVANG